jgi:3-methyladenine DNA glycosylase AlkD
MEVQAKIAQDKEMLSNLTCPVCNLCLKDGNLKDKRRSLKQHISRKVEAEHRLWCELFWSIHFVKGGYKLQPREYGLQEVKNIVHSYFNMTI